MNRARTVLEVICLYAKFRVAVDREQCIKQSINIKGSSTESPCPEPDCTIVDPISCITCSHYIGVLSGTRSTFHMF